MSDLTMPKREPGVQVHTSETEALVTDPATGTVYKLNPTALAIWELCDGVTTIDEAASSLAELTGEPIDDIEDDIRQALGELRGFGLIE